MTPVVTAMDAVTLASGGVWTLTTFGGFSSAVPPVGTTAIVLGEPVPPRAVALAIAGKVRFALLSAKSAIVPPASANEVVDG